MTSLSTPPEHDPDEETHNRFRVNGTPCEWGESYHPFGLHPVHLGDTFEGRYEVVRKLGHGSFSTVWLVIDQQQQHFASMKILRASKSTAQVENEILFHQSLYQVNRLGAQNVVELRDSFIHSGPNGQHICLIFEPMGPHLSEFLRRSPEFEYGNILDDVWGMRFPIPITRRVLRDALLGLHTLHRNNIIHGDLHQGNLLVCIDQTQLNSKSVREVSQLVEEADPLVRLDGKRDLWAPSYLVPTKPLQGFTSTELDPLVKISDLGSAFLADSPPAKIITPTSLRSPEVILGLKLTKAVDVWSFGCLMFNLLTERSLFHAHGGDESSSFDEELFDEHLIQISEILCPLPEHMFYHWRRGHSYFDTKGNRSLARDEVVSRGQDPNRDGSTDLEKTLSERESPLADIEPCLSLETLFKRNMSKDVSEAEETEMLEIMRWTLQPDPALRPCVEEILQKPWFHR